MLIYKLKINLANMKTKKVNFKKMGYTMQKQKKGKRDEYKQK